MSIGDIATSGMNAAMSAMEVTSNNISNANTTGFKSSYADFADLYPASGGMQPGLGVQLADIAQDFSEGSILSTDRTLDMSIANSSFFTLRDPNSGLITYTRAGRFDEDVNGYIISGAQRLQMFPAVDGIVLPSAGLVDAQIPNTTFSPVATADVGLNINLNSSLTTPTNTFSSSDSTSFNYRTDQTIYDSLGNSYQLSLFYIKQASPLVNTWNVETQVNGTQVGEGTLTFTDAGALATTSGMGSLSFTPSAGAASPQTLDITFTGSTQVAGANTNRSLTQDGNAAGTPNGFTIDTSGNVTMSYSNSMTLIIGQIALSSFAAPSGLQYVGNQSWTATTASGTANTTVANSNGAIKSNTLEGSNVNLTQEMVNLLGSQQDFQADAQVEQVFNDIMQTILKL